MNTMRNIYAEIIDFDYQLSSCCSEEGSWSMEASNPSIGAWATSIHEISSRSWQSEAPHFFL